MNQHFDIDTVIVELTYCKHHPKEFVTPWRDHDHRMWCPEYIKYQEEMERGQALYYGYYPREDGIWRANGI